MAPKKKIAEEAPEVEEVSEVEVTEEVTEKSDLELVEMKIQGQRVAGYVMDIGGRKTLTTLKGVTYDV